MRASEELARGVLRLQLPDSCRILLAVSGGPDSMALLETCVWLVQGGREWELRVGHVNHGLRGEESEEDERFVRAAAASRGLEAVVVQVDTRGFASRMRLSLEEAARELRYAALGKMLTEWPGDLMATGHTLEDQAETVLLRLLRGAGLSGLAGMPERRSRLVRPFLHVSRSLVLQALEEQGTASRIDSSNADSRHTRNRLRAQVMPAIRRLQPHADELIDRTAHLLAADAEYVQREADRSLSSLDLRSSSSGESASLAAWRALHPALQRETIRLLLKKNLGSLRNIDARHVESARSALLGMRPLHGALPGGLQLLLDRERFALRRPEPRPPRLETVPLPVPGQVDLAVGTLHAAVLEGLDRGEVERLITVCGPMHALLDGSLVAESLTVRSRLPGDRVQPLGMDGSRKLQDVMVDRGIPATERDRIPVVTDGLRILWIPGVVMDQRAAISGATTRIVHLRFRLEPPTTVLQ